MRKKIGKKKTKIYCGKIIMTIEKLRSVLKKNEVVLSKLRNLIGAEVLEYPISRKENSIKYVQKLLKEL